MDEFKPSVFTPFLRRFGDERARDTSDVRALYAKVRDQHRRSRFSNEAALLTFCQEIWTEFSDCLPESCHSAFRGALWEICALEAQIFGLPPAQFDFLNLKQASDLRHFLRRKEYFHIHEAQIVALLRDNLLLLFRWLARMLPQTEEPSPFTIPLVYALPNPKETLDRVLGELSQDKYRDAGLFVEVFRRLWINTCQASDVDPYDTQKPPKLPSKTDLPLDKLIETFCKGTPFYELFLAPIPLKFTIEDRFSHMHVLGGSGAGKTQLLQNLILHDLQSEETPSLILVDSQGDLIDKVLHLDLFNLNGSQSGNIADRLWLITPKDITHPPALNVFALNQDRMRTYDESQKEQVVAGAIQTFDYLFSGLLGADLTAKQSVFFRFVARLMLALPETMGRNATILDILNLLETPEEYRGAIESLPPIQRNFFERDLLDPKKATFKETREQIRYRLNAILENPTLARLFTAPETKIDLFSVLNQGGIVLVDTAKAFLKDASAHFGRIFIALTLQAILERAAIPEHKRRPTFLIVDEAANYFDSNIDDFLTEARKYKCGCILAHQYLDQASSGLRASFAANTSMKLVSRVSAADARSLAPELRTSPDFILSQPKLHFAAHFRDVTPQAISIPVAVGQLESEPRMDEETFGRLLERNRARVGIDRRDSSLADKFELGPEPSPGQHAPETIVEPKAGSAISDPSSHGQSDANDPTAPTEEW